jgi:hypothetical protein
MRKKFTAAALAAVVAALTLVGITLALAPAASATDNSCSNSWLENRRDDGTHALGVEYTDSTGHHNVTTVAVDYRCGSSGTWSIGAHRACVWHIAGGTTRSTVNRSSYTIWQQFTGEHQIVTHCRVV